jgi:hypothetical protein
LSSRALLLIVVIVIVSEVETDLARDGALPQSRTTKCGGSLDALLRCARGPHPPTSVNAPQVCVFAAPRRLHEGIQDKRIDRVGIRHAERRGI